MTMKRHTKDHIALSLAVGIIFIGFIFLNDRAGHLDSLQEIHANPEWESPKPICAAVDVPRSYSQERMDLANICITSGGWRFLLPPGLTDSNYVMYVEPVIDSLRTAAIETGLYLPKFDSQIYSR